MNPESSTVYTAPCRRCGRRLHLSEDELLASLSAPPACWHCDRRDRDHPGPRLGSVDEDEEQIVSHTLYALYHHPEDPAAFDRHYADTHSGLGLAFPGLRSFTGTHPGPGADGTPSPYYFVAALTFDDQQSLDAALSGPEGAAAVADLANFAGAGVELVNGSTTVYR